MDENLIRIRHERSKKDFPFLKLEDDEFVEFAFRRAKICFMVFFGGLVAGFVVILLMFLLILLGSGAIDPMGRNFMYIMLTALVVVAVITGAVGMMIFKGNRLFLTNKHAIQMVMDAPMATSVNIIDLKSIEDASFSQKGILQKYFNYGTLRLSTVGDETTYTFKYSDISPSELKAVSKLISAAKK